MNKATLRAASFIACRRSWRLPCCYVQTTFRFRSTATTAATSSIEASQAPCSSIKQTPPQPLFQPESSVAWDVCSLQPQAKERRRKNSNKRTAKEQAQAQAQETSSSIPHPKECSEPSLQPLTYQGQAATDNDPGFLGLKPAPFPKDIHSCMPYVNRNVLYKRIHEAQSINHTHNDLESFEGLDHNTSSTIYRGTLFEYQTQEILKKHLGIYTQRSAGNGDLGIDLRGTWFLPLSASAEPGDMVRHLKVIVQCKKMSSKVGPKFVRELQGSLSYETQPTMAILAISSEFTKQALLPYAKSLWPMALVVIDTKKQECRKLMWNRAAEKVMHGLQVATRWYKGEDGQLESRPVLCFKGELIKRLPGPHLNEGKREADQDMESMETANTSPIDYSIPNWNINTKPEYLRIVPKATGGWDRADLEGEDADHPPLHSNHLELLSWSPPFPIQESIQPSTE